ncbi:MAG: helix-turn-helix domain-containing protein [Rhodoferax sp.]|nr:helix-turn-helix domain-containing protein [Rhodoferax sp.]
MSNQIQTAGFSEAEASIYLGISRSTLRHGRCDGKRANRMPPPPFVRAGRRIIYLRSDLDAWLSNQRTDLAPHKPLDR